MKENGWCMYGRTRGDKDILVQKFEPSKDLLLWAWMGEHDMDIFQLTAEDLKEYYK